MPHLRSISVIGGARVAPQSYQRARELGKELAKRKCVVITGGRTGVMEAVAKGCQEGGGLAIGILPGTEKHQANPFINVAIPTGLGDARNILVVRAGDGIIAMEGGWGTISELAFARILKKPVVVLTGDGRWTELLNTARFRKIPRVETPAQAVQQIMTMIAEYER